MLKTLEEKALADDQILHLESAVKIQMFYRRHLCRMRVLRAVRMATMKKRESVRRIWHGWQYRKRRTAAREWRKSLWEVCFQWKNHDLPFKNPDFLSRNPDFLLKKC